MRRASGSPAGVCQPENPCPPLPVAGSCHRPACLVLSKNAGWPFAGLEHKTEARCRPWALLEAEPPWPFCRPHESRPSWQPLPSCRPAFPLASLLPAESYNDYVHRCAVSMEQIVSTCSQDGECPLQPWVRAAPGLSFYLCNGSGWFLKLAMPQTPPRHSPATRVSLPRAVPQPPECHSPTPFSSHQSVTSLSLDRHTPPPARPGGPPSSGAESLGLRAAGATQSACATS